MREHSEDARFAEAQVLVEVGDVLEHRQRLVDLVEVGGLDHHPRLAERGNAEQHGVAEPLRDVEQLLGVDDPLIERRGESSRLGGVQQHTEQGDLVAESTGARDGFVRERQATLPFGAL